MFNLYFVNGEMWQKRYPTKASAQGFEDQWRRRCPLRRASVPESRSSHTPSMNVRGN